MHATAYSHIIKSHMPLIEPSQVQEWHTEALRQCMAHSLRFHSSLSVQFCWCQPCLTSGLCRFGHAFQSSAGHGTQELLQDRCSAGEPGVWQDWAGFEHHNLFQFWGFSMLFFFWGEWNLMIFNCDARIVKLPIKWVSNVSCRPLLLN